MGFKKEHWKKGDYVVLRDEKGRIVSYSKKDKKVSVKRYKETYHSNKTFKENLVKSRFIKHSSMTGRSGVQEYKLKNPKSVPKGGAWYYVSITFKNTRQHFKDKEITARSSLFYTKQELPLAKEEAYRNVKARIAQAFGNEYNEDEGDKVLEHNKYTVDEGIIYYRDVRPQAQSSEA